MESLAHDSGRTLLCAEYGYPKGSPNTNSYRRNPQLQLSIQCSPQRTPKWPNSKPHWATRQQAIAKTPAKLSAYQILSVIVIFVILVVKVQFVGFIPQKPQEALNLLVTEESYWALFYMPLYTFIHNLLNALVHQKPQETLNLLVTEERYWTLFYMPLYTCFYTICWMYWYRL
jgi:hypothetical protein